MESIQIIYTTEQDGQFVANLPYHKETFKNKKTLIIFAMAAFYGKFCFLAEEWKMETYSKVSDKGTCRLPTDIPALPSLHKLSFFVSSDDKIPAWYNSCDGKIYKADLLEFTNTLIAQP